jgi:uncharacterized surface protein with fasciclin (FAS1) repeats
MNRILIVTLATIAVAARVNAQMCMGSDQSIVDIASSNPDFSTLVQAVQAAGLVDALNGAGPLAVFAPTDAAFATALSNLGISAADLLAQTDLLKQILAFHVVSTGASCDKPLSGSVQTLLPGNSFTIDGNTITDGTGAIANIVSTVPASNGQIFVIDNVLLPALPQGGAPASSAVNTLVAPGEVDTVLKNGKTITIKCPFSSPGGDNYDFSGTQAACAGSDFSTTEQCDACLEALVSPIFSTGFVSLNDEVSKGNLTAAMQIANRFNVAADVIEQINFSAGCPWALACKSVMVEDVAQDSNQETANQVSMMLDKCTGGANPGPDYPKAYAIVRQLLDRLEAFQNSNQ